MIELQLIEKYKNAYKKLVLLDYDGTLVNYSPLPDKATPPDQLLGVLEKLIRFPQTRVIVITGRRIHDIDNFLGHLPIDIMAEHGALNKVNGKWEKLTQDDGSWKNKVLPLLNRITLTCPNSFVEEKHFSLTWHYRNVETNTGFIHSRELIRLLENVAQSYNLRIIDGKKVVEIVTAEIDKGKAVRQLIEPNDYDGILCIGDDETDEDMFRYLKKYENAVTIKVGKEKTFAKYRLETVEEVILLLEKLSK